MNNRKARGINRRSFLRSTAAVGAGLAISPSVFGQATAQKKDDINVALLGTGTQGQVLLNACMKIPNIRFRAVCDIWEAYNLKRVSNLLKKYKIEHNAYTDYKEMLDKQKDLDAVVIATPDFWHSEHSVACLKAGLNVYCEKEMSNTIEGAKAMVQAARETGKLLQIGHQRRSNPRYIHCYDKIIKAAKLLGHITTINGQWNRGKASCEDFGWPKETDLDKATLEKYGFESMHQFRNWRWFKKFGGGPIVDLGSHQIDVYAWFLEANPKSVIASGGVDYWKGHEWYDHVLAIYEYQTQQGMVRAFYQTITTNSGNGYYELFMGDEGSLLISEAAGRGETYREAWLPEDHWDKWVQMGYLVAPVAEKKEEKPADATGIEVYESPKPPCFKLPVTLDKLVHQPHLENFFDAIRGKAKLTCPAEVGYETAVAVLKVNEAVEAGKKLDFKPEEFKV